jgi:hypothetical protein
MTLSLIFFADGKVAVFNEMFDKFLPTIYENLFYFQVYVYLTGDWYDEDNKYHIWRETVNIDDYKDFLENCNIGYSCQFEFLDPVVQKFLTDTYGYFKHKKVEIL